MKPERKFFERLRVIIVKPSKPNGDESLFFKGEEKIFIEKGVNLKKFPLISRTNLFIIFKELLKFLCVIKDFNPHVLHAQYGTMTAFFCAVASIITRTPLIITFRGSDLNRIPKIDGFFRDIIRRFLSQLAALRAAKIICVSNRLTKKLWWKRSYVEVIPTIVDFKLFYPMLKEKAREKLGWELNEKIVLFNANNPKVKRLDIAKAAVSEAKKFISNIRLEVLRGNILKDLMPLYLNASDCLLLCSDSEGSPTIVREALACNLPVVSVDVGDVAEQLEGVYPSKIVEKNPKAISMAIVEIVNMNCRSNGRSILSSRDLSTMKIIDIYLTLSNLQLKPA